MIIADITIEAGRSTIQQIPANYNTFLYVLRGSVLVGEGGELNENQVGWLNLMGEDAESDLLLTAGKEGVRIVLYAGKPTGESIVSHGPFIADSSEDIKRLYQEYREGRMKHISKVGDSQRILW
jgi:redox-sensitive bicupin YhaK (pirin superfamily)